MTARQIELIRAEILRHAELARASREPEIHSGHMEVAAALSAAIGEDKLCIRKTSILGRLWRWATSTASSHRPSPRTTRAADIRGSAQSPAR